MAGYAGYIPVSQTPYLLSSMFAQEKFAMLLATGVLNAKAMDGEINKGDFITIPTACQADDFQRVDLTDETAAAGTRATTKNQIAPIIRHYTQMTFTEHDNIRTNESWRELFAASAGNKLAKDVIVTLHAALQGAMNVGGLNHLLDLQANPITVQSIRKAKKLLGDQGHNVDTLLLHPDVWSDFIYDLTINYKYSGNLAGQWLANGNFEAIFGIKNVIVSNDVAPIAAASSAYGGDQYYTWLFKSAPDVAAGEESLGGPIFFGYQAAPRYSEFVDTRVPSTLTYNKWNTDYALGVRGMAFTGGTTGSPTYNELLNPSRWAQANNDDRQVGVVAIKSQGGVY
jgi:hypothetical protein